MKIQLLSDIHLEFGHKVQIDNAGADVLVLAGDICSARNVNDYVWFFRECASKFKNVIYIMGNHEHYKHTFNDTAKVIRECLLEHVPSNFYFLDNETVHINGVKFVASTLWTNMNNRCPMTMNKLQFGMNDFRLIKYRNNKDDYYKFQPYHAYGEHVCARNFIDNVIDDWSDDAPIVVVTHHLPSFKSVPAIYANDTHMNGGYASNLEYMMTDRVKLWLHGHTHTPCDYMVNNTRVVCNPHGYPGENKNVNLGLVLEVL